MRDPPTTFTIFSPVPTVPFGTITCIIAFYIETVFRAIIESWIPTFINICRSREELIPTPKYYFICRCIIRTYLDNPMEVWDYGCLGQKVGPTTTGGGSQATPPPQVVAALKYPFFF
jgi:hypothetical protein